MRKLTALLILFFCVLTTVYAASAAASDEFWGVRKKDNGSGATLPLLMGTGSIDVGDTVTFLVNRDNFYWVAADGSDGTGDGVLFTSRLIEENALRAYAEGAGASLFSTPELVALGGELYIRATALAAGDAVLLQVGVVDPIDRGMLSKQWMAISSRPDPNPGTDSGTDPGTDSGTDPGTDPDTDPGTDLGTDPDPGTDPDTDPGTDPGTDPDTDPGTDSGADPDPVQLRITGIAPAFSLQSLVDREWSELHLFAGDSLWLPLPASAFRWVDGGGAAASAPEDSALTLLQLDTGEIGVQLGAIRPEQIFAYAALVQRTEGVGIELEVAGLILPLEDLPFSGPLYLTCRGERTANAKAVAEGTIHARVEYPGAGTDNIGNSAVSSARESSGGGSMTPDPQTPVPDRFYKKGEEIISREKSQEINANDNPATGGKYFFKGHAAKTDFSSTYYM